MRMTTSGTPSTPQYYLTFNASTTAVNCGSNASLDDLSDAAMTVEAWVRADGSWGEGGYGIISSKWNGSAGWVMYTNAAKITVEVWCDTSVGRAISTASLVDATWHHVAFTWDDATAGRPSIYIDGAYANSGTGIDRNGGIKTDAPYNLVHGSWGADQSTWDGNIAWVRVSNNIRYSGPFTPDAKDAPPAVDGNTVEQWNLNDGSGTTAAAEVNSSNNGTITDGAWRAL